MHDQKEAVKPRAATRRRLVLGAGAVGAGAVLAGLRFAVGAPPTPNPPPVPAPRDDGPGYVLMDLAAIKAVVRGRNRPVLVHFWASWCGPCLEELPVIERFARDVRARGVDFVSLSLDKPERAGARVVRILADSAPSLTRAIVNLDDRDSDAFISAIDARWEGAIPAVFAYDSKGQLRGRLIGEATRRDLDSLASRLVKPGTVGTK